jgi:hypothetical protein
MWHMNKKNIHLYPWIMVSSGMSSRVTVAKTDVSEEFSTSIIRVTRICELGTTLDVTSNRRTPQRNTKWSDISSQRVSVASYGYVPSSLIFVTLMMEALSSSETSVLARVTWRNIPEDTILHSHCRENFKSYICTLFLCRRIDFHDLEASDGTVFSNNSICFSDGNVVALKRAAHLIHNFYSCGPVFSISLPFLWFWVTSSVQSSCTKHTRSHTLDTMTIGKNVNCGSGDVVSTYKTTWCHHTEILNLYNCRSENLEIYLTRMVTILLESI